MFKSFNAPRQMQSTQKPMFTVFVNDIEQFRTQRQGALLLNFLSAEQFAQLFI